MSTYSFLKGPASSGLETKLMESMGRFQVGVIIVTPQNIFPKKCQNFTKKQSHFSKKIHEYMDNIFM